jgi:hypothetical protein
MSKGFGEMMFNERLERIGDLADELNRKTDADAEEIRSVEDRLIASNIGISIAIPYLARTTRDEEFVCYGRQGGKYRIYFRFDRVIAKDDGDQRKISSMSVSWSSADREERRKIHSMLPELVEAIISRAESMLIARRQGEIYTDV